jgi:hypothetical protein
LSWTLKNTMMPSTDNTMKAKLMPTFRRTSEFCIRFQPRANQCTPYAVNASAAMYRACVERVEQGKAGEQVHARAHVHVLAAWRVAHEFLRAVDQVSGAEAEEAHSKRREGGLGEGEHCLG